MIGARRQDLHVCFQIFDEVRPPSEGLVSSFPAVDVAFCIYRRTDGFKQPALVDKTLQANVEINSLK